MVENMYGLLREAWDAAAQGDAVRYMDKYIDWLAKMPEKDPQMVRPPWHQFAQGYLNTYPERSLAHIEEGLRSRDLPIFLLAMPMLDGPDSPGKALLPPHYDKELPYYLLVMTSRDSVERLRKRRRLPSPEENLELLRDQTGFPFPRLPD